jgi:hypothetical protein
MLLTFEIAAETYDRNVAHAWIGRDATLRWQVVFIEWEASLARLLHKRFTALYSSGSEALSGEQARAVLDVLTWKAEHGDELDGITLEV